MRRGYVKHYRTWTAKRQMELLKAAQVPERVIYDDDWSACLKSLRAGDRLVVGGGLRVLGENRKEIRAAVDAVKARGATVEDAETGRLAGGDDGVALLDEALSRLHGEKVMPSSDHAREMQAKGHRNRTKGRMPKREAQIIWRDPRWTGPELEAKMTGWTLRTAYRAFGARGVPAGPRSVRNKPTEK